MTVFFSISTDDAVWSVQRKRNKQRLTVPKMAVQKHITEIKAMEKHRLLGDCYYQ